MIEKAEQERASAEWVEMVEQYADIDEDEDSPFGGAIFHAKFGFTVEDVLDEGGDAEDMAKTVVMTINHLNYPDDEMRVYCRVRNAIVAIAAAECLNCPLYCGSMQGAGVECMYLDLVSNNINVMALTVPEPAAQLAWIEKLIDRRLIPADTPHKGGKL
jgi:hypothetical protein